MKYLIILLCLPLTSWACVNFIAESEVPKAIALESGAGAKACGGADPCVCFDGVDWETAVWADVDDLTRPKFLKAEVETCAGQAECQSALQSKSCEDGQALIAADYTEVYCAIPNGFHKKKEFQVDQAKLAAKTARVHAESQRQALIQNGLRRQDIGKRIIALIVANNDAKDLTPEQSIQLTGQFQPIIALLQVGAIETAKAQVQALVPDSIMTQADKDLALSQFTAEGY